MLLLLCSGLSSLSAQQRSLLSDYVDIRPKLNSPLSRFGLGNPVGDAHAAPAGMGGLQAAFQDPYHLNLTNPASLASLQAASLEIGLYVRTNELNDPTGSTSTLEGNLEYLALGFPLRNPVNLNLDRLANEWNGGMAFSLAPTTRVGYDVRLEGNDENWGRTSNVLKGNGGLYRFRWSTAFRYKGISVGGNLNYNFGKITNSRIVAFEDLEEALATEFLEDVSMSGLNFDYGLQYAYIFKDQVEGGELQPNGKRIIVGLSGKLGRELDAESSVLFRRFSPSGQLYIPDTLSEQSQSDLTIELPASFTVGVAFEDFNRLFVGAEYGSAAYSDYRNEAQPEDLMDASHFSFGMQYIPNANSYNQYFQRVRYRLGVRFEKDPRQLDGVQARRNAVTLGMGLPLRLPRRQVSFMDIAFEFGKFGVPDVLDETYFQCKLGFSLNDNTWFFKRKLN